MRDIMSLQPIRFNTAQDLNDFLGHLQVLNLITLEDGSIKTTPEFAKQFVKATDGSIYFLNDVMDYLNEASEEEINTSGLSFLVGLIPIVSLPSVEVKSVTLAQIKADPNLVEQLHRVEVIPAFISLLNPNLYSDKPFTALVGKEAIAKARASFTNKKLSEAVIVANSALSTIDNLMSLVTLLKTSSIPLQRNSSDFLLNFHQDTYKITLMQQIKLKYRLQKELKFTKDSGDRKLLLQWIGSLNRDNAAIRQLLSRIMDRLQVHNESIKEARIKYAKMLTDDPSFEKLKAEIEAKTKEAKELFESIENTESVFAVLKPILAYGAMISLYLLLLTAVIVAPALIMALTATMPLLGLSLVIIETLSVILLSSLAVEAIIDLGGLIENKLDSVVDEKREQHVKLSKELTELQMDNLFRTVFSQNSTEFIANGSTHDAFIEQIENDLFEIDTLEAEEASKMDYINRQPKESKASIAGLFRQRPEVSRHTAEDFVELTARGAFEI